MTQSPYNGAFEPPLNNESAYWLGFIWADGSIGNYGRAYQFSIGLQDRDAYHVENIVDFLGYPEDRIRQRDSASHFQARSIDLYNDLWEWGIRPNKSQHINEIYCDREYMGPFLRGLFDGDGSIGVYERDGGRSPRPRFAFYGRQLTVELMKNEIEDRADIELGRVGRKETGVFEVRTAARENMRPIFELFYSDDAPRLDRKYHAFKEAIELDPVPYRSYEKYDEQGRGLVEIVCCNCEEVAWIRGDTERKSENNFCERECYYDYVSSN